MYPHAVVTLMPAIHRICDLGNPVTDSRTVGTQAVGA